MGIHGSRRNTQALCDVLVGTTFRDQCQDLHLTRAHLHFHTPRLVLGYRNERTAMSARRPTNGCNDVTDCVIAPYGEWPSPVGAGDVARARVRVEYPTVRAGRAWWQETPPGRDGRTTVIRRDPDGSRVSVIPDGYEPRSRVHEYGGRSYLPVPSASGDGWSVVFANYTDQRLYLVGEGVDPIPLTPVPLVESGSRYADFVPSPDGSQVWCVREENPAEGRPVRAIVSVPMDGSGATNPAAVRELVTGADFLAFPTPSPDGTHLAWICWHRPDMPWDATELRVARLDPVGPVTGRRLLGGPAESVVAPTWLDNETLYVISDRTGWWNVHSIGLADERPRIICALAEEFAEPLWNLGERPFTVLPGGELAVVHGRGALRLGVLDPDTGAITDVETPYTAFAPGVSADGYSIGCVAAGPESPACVLVVDLIQDRYEVVGTELDVTAYRGYLPTAEAVEFVDDAGAPIHAFVYPPSNSCCQGPEDALPPYVVWVHGGPTGHETGTFDLGKVYFTSRGIGVLDVNYGGSSGYGRAYRNRLRNNWGVVDVADAVAAARALVAAGRADGGRLAIRGASAGGWTALVAVTSGIARHGAVFAAATSYFGVTNLELLTAHTHDFESHYFDSLVGPLPESADCYRARSPHGHVTSLTCPVLLLQGLLDPVVPPDQSVALLAELTEHGIEHRYLSFGNEAHGFRRQETIQACFDTELSFYGRIFGFIPSSHSTIQSTRSTGRQKTPSRPPSQVGEVVDDQTAPSLLSLITHRKYHQEFPTCCYSDLP
jgi:dipeptidyl aminopeptidase/acylaminoacyl peptidase